MSINTHSVPTADDSPSRMKQLMNICIEIVRNMHLTQQNKTMVAF